MNGTARTRRHARRAARPPWRPTRLIVAALVLATFALPHAAAAHSPTPYSTSASWSQDQRLEFRWRAGEVPPTWMQAAIRAGADDSNDSRMSRAAVLAYASDGAATVAYDDAIGCGAAAIACTTRFMPTTFLVEMRRHGTVYDWGTLRWCQAFDSAPDGCFDAENLALHEFGHVQTLTHHVNHDGDGDYRDSVVQEVSRSKPRAGWNDHVYGRCDTASLQRRYDVRSSSALYSTCLSLDTALSLTPTPATASYRGVVAFTASLRVAAVTGYGKLSGNAVSGRSVVLQRRPIGGSAWTTVGTMTPGSAAGTYSLALSLTLSADWRALFADPSREGLNGTASGVARVSVAGCSGTCPSDDDPDAI
jgi:hypothetical protein